VKANCVPYEEYVKSDAYLPAMFADMIAYCEEYGYFSEKKGKTRGILFLFFPSSFIFISFCFVCVSDISYLRFCL
jgi:hypothetical protein